MSTVTRDRIHYRVGNENNPSDPWGRSMLCIEADGTARLDQHEFDRVSSWTGKVATSALEQFWGALAESGFPVVPPQLPPAGSSTRLLQVGKEPDAPSAYVAYHFAGTLPGYKIAFSILDTIVRQLSENMVTAVPESAPIVEGVTRIAR